MLTHIFEITIGQTFSGGLIDFILYGILQGNAKTNWILVPIIGIVWFFLYYFTFRFLIVKLKLKTPGREEKIQSEPDVTSKNTNESPKTGAARSIAIVNGLGGVDNIKDLDCCATRLRVSVMDIDKVEKDALVATGAKAVLLVGSGVQVIYGPQVTVIKNEIEEYMETE
jgi:PTS system maltose and glucose-specific IIC component